MFANIGIVLSMFLFADTRRRTGFDRACMEDVTPRSSPPRPSAPQPTPERVPDPVFVQDEKPSLAGKGHRAEGAPRATRWGAREPSPLHEFQESAAPSVDSPKASGRLSDKLLERQQGDKVSERSFESEPERLSGREPERIEAVTPQRENDSEEDMKEDLDHSSKENLTRDEDRKSNDSDTAKEGRTSSGSELGAPTVDEFGRLIRQGGSDSDGENTPHARLVLNLSFSLAVSFMFVIPVLALICVLYTLVAKTQLVDTNETACPWT